MVAASVKTKMLRAWYAIAACGLTARAALHPKNNVEVIWFVALAAWNLCELLRSYAKSDA